MERLDIVTKEEICLLQPGSVIGWLMGGKSIILEVDKYTIHILYNNQKEIDRYDSNYDIIYKQALENSTIKLLHQ